MIRRAMNAQSEIPLPGVEYRAGKSRSPVFSHVFSRFSRRGVILTLSSVLLLTVLLYRSTLLMLSRSALCVHPFAFSLAKAPLLDKFAGVAAAQRAPELRALSTLVVVAGHAIYTGAEWTPAALRDERHWVLQRSQHGQVATFLRHIERGVEFAGNDSASLLLFSGGQTRAGAGPRSEGLTYWLVAEAHGWFGRPAVRARAMAEEYARDSFENLLFSVCRFKQVSGNYPRKIQVVSFGFKQLRFVEVHRRAIRFPLSRFEFVGIDPPDAQRSIQLAAAERKFSVGAFAGDPEGCNNEGLRAKKIDRNPYLRFFPYPQGCPELVELFRHCGQDIYEGSLPWDGLSDEK